MDRSNEQEAQAPQEEEWAGAGVVHQLLDDDNQEGDAPPQPQAAAAVAVAAGEEETGNEEAQDDQGNSPFRSPTDLSRILSQDNPDRMKLTREEHTNAVNIKQAAEATPELENQSDLWYAHLAIICRDNVEDAISKCWAMQYFRHEYQIEHRYNQACQLFDWEFREFPRHYLHFGFSPSAGTYFFVGDFAKFDPSLLRTPKLADDLQRLHYYLLFIFFPDLESVRKGVILATECSGLSFRRDVAKHVGKSFSEFLCHFPHRTKYRFYNTGAMANVLLAMLRKILPEHLRATFTVGHQVDGHLADTFLVPSLEVANAKMLHSMKAAMQLRLDNEKSFSLTIDEPDSARS